MKLSDDDALVNEITDLATKIAKFEAKLAVIRARTEEERAATRQAWGVGMIVFVMGWIVGWGFAVGGGAEYGRALASGLASGALVWLMWFGISAFARALKS